MSIQEILYPIIIATLAIISTAIWFKMEKHVLIAIHELYIVYKGETAFELYDWFKLQYYRTYAYIYNIKIW